MVSLVVHCHQSSFPLPAPCSSFASTPLRALPRQTSQNSSRERITRAGNLYIKQPSDTHLYYTFVLHLTFPHFWQSNLTTQNCNFQDTSPFMKCYEVLIFKVPADSFRECGAEGCCFNLFCACYIITTKSLSCESPIVWQAIPSRIFQALMHTKTPELNPRHEK